ncbi:hypothetical protein GCM10007052_13390 [Halioglobus japonicus]|nr:hypothetical protein GCM10007052_13390 [Halioglobus japonicus]
MGIAAQHQSQAVVGCERLTGAQNMQKVVERDVTALKQCLPTQARANEEWAGVDVVLLEVPQDQASINGTDRIHCAKLDILADYDTIMAITALLNFYANSHSDTSLNTVGDER